MEEQLKQLITLCDSLIEGLNPREFHLGSDGLPYGEVGLINDLKGVRVVAGHILKGIGATKLG